MKQFRFLLLLLLFAACLIADSQVVLAANIEVVAVQGQSVSNILLNEYSEITGKVMRFYQEVYDFVPTKPVQIIVVPDESSYSHTLQLFGYAQEQAVREAKASAGISIGSRQAIIICADKNVNYLARIRIITHEMFHQIQWQLKGNISAYEWLTEGSARVNEHLMLEWLKKGSLGSRHQNLINGLANVKLKAEPKDMIDKTKWISLMEQKMFPYEVSELMTDYLLEQTGKLSILKYFSYIGETGSNSQAFKKAFGMSHNQYINKYKAFISLEESTIGQIKFDVEGEVAPEMVQEIQNSGKNLEQLLRSQGWRPSMTQRYILVPNQDIMLTVMRRELPEMEDEKLSEIARRSIIAPLGGMNLVFDTGKATNSEIRFFEQALAIYKEAILMTAQPAKAADIHWLYQGEARLLAVNASETAGFKNADSVRQSWIDVIQNAKSYPSLAEMKGSLGPVSSRYGEKLVINTAALAVKHLTEKTSSDKVGQYFVVLRDINDGPKAFKQVFGMELETFNAEFAAYLKSLSK